MFKHKLELTHDELMVLLYKSDLITWREMGNLDYDTVSNILRDKLLRLYKGGRSKPKSVAEVWDAVNSVCKGR